MATIGEIKQKKGVGGGNLYVYNFDTTGRRSNHQKQQEPAEGKKKSGFHSGFGWGSLRRSKTVREVLVVHNGSRVTGSKDPTAEYVEEDEKKIVEAPRRSAAATTGQRKSVSHLEVNVGAVAAFLQVKVLVTDMPGFMQVHAFRYARGTYDSLDKFSSKHMAYNIKKEFDKVYGPAWHCIVGSSFGSFVTHSTGCFLYFSMEKLYILVFKTKVQRNLPPSN